jgi:hypothetical protein
VDAGDMMVMVGVDRLTEGSRVNAQVPGEAAKGGDDKSGGGGAAKGKKGGKGKQQ